MAWESKPSVCAASDLQGVSQGYTPLLCTSTHICKAPEEPKLFWAVTVLPINYYQIMPYNCPPTCKMAFSAAGLPLRRTTANNSTTFRLRGAVQGQEGQCIVREGN